MSVTPTNYITTIPPPSWIQSDAPTTDFAGIIYWSGIASSSNGQNMAAVTTSGTIYTSTTSGQTWSLMYPTLPPNPPNSFTSIASSSNGQILYATSPNTTGTGGVFVSTNGGVNWTTISSLQSIPNNWIDVSCDGTGQNVVVSGWDLISPPIISGVYYSTNYGSSFTPINPSSVNLRFASITSNTGSGQYVAVVTTSTSTNGVNGGIYYSNDYGSSWSQSNAPLSINDSTYINVWTSIDCDSTGQYMAATYGGTTGLNFGVWLSTNYGANWSQSSLIQNNLASISSSSNGSILITCRNGVDGVEQIWISTNYGANWTGISTLLACRSITINYDGTLSAVGTSGIYYYNNYSISGTFDLADVFAPYTSGTKAATTGYKVNETQDLADIFAPYTSGTKAVTTGYKINEIQDLSDVFAPYPIFTTTGTSQYVSGYYIITFTNTITPGTIIFNTTISNVSIICVAGGGCGGGGGPTINDYIAGSGGGGGGNYLLSVGTISLNDVYSVTIGSGGIPGDDSTYGGGGGNSQVSTGTTSILECSGGGGGGSGFPGGLGGIVTIGGSGGSGGNGGNVASVSQGNGQSSSSFITPFTIPSALVSYINTSYSGGGGASSYSGNSNAGAAGANGVGGLVNGFLGLTGQSATTPGSGGGGAGGDINIMTAGGAGAPGIVIFYFQYP